MKSMRRDEEERGEDTSSGVAEYYSSSYIDTHQHDCIE